MPTNTNDQPDQTLMVGEESIRKWLDEIQQAEKREEKWRKNARAAQKIYEGDDKVDYQFNILYSNTETLNPALYSRVPRPRCQRRFKDDDPVGLAAARVLQRTLEFLIDDGADIYPDFDSLMGSSVLDALVVGRGSNRFKYDAYFAEQLPRDVTPQTDETKKFGKEVPGHPEELKAKGAQLVWETVCGEVVHWDRFCHGYARVWTDVPWIAYKWPMTREEVMENFGPELAAEVKYGTASETDLDGDKKTYDSQDSNPNAKVAWIHEIWDKRDKKVKFITESIKDRYLKLVDDPLGLTGFFPQDEPLMFFNRVTSICPQTLYVFYEEQARELNRITGRINRLTDALKARGMYDGTIQGIELLFKEQDNALLPAENCMALYEKGGLKNAIWFLPLGEIITVLQQLHVQRSQIKQVIYEITGVSDILRGSSVATETATAQRIKDQWGNLRLKRLQKVVQKYAVGSLRIMAEIACLQFSMETFQKMSGLSFPTMQEKQAAQQQLQMMQMQAQQPGPDGQPQQPQEPDPTMLMTAESPAWEEIMQVLKSDLNRNFRIDIETNSTVDAEATEDKQNMTEMVNALSQLIIGFQPLIENGSMPFDAAKSIMLAVVRRFNLGDEVEDELKQMQAPQQGEDEEVAKQKEELAKQQQDMEKQQGQMEIEKEKQKLQMQAQQQQMEAERQLQAKLMELERTIQQIKMDAKQTEFETRMEAERLINQFSQQSQQQEVARQNEHEENERHQGIVVEDAVRSIETQAADAEAARQRANDSAESKRNIAAEQQRAKMKDKPAPKK